MIKDQDLEHIAHLARLEYTPEALQALKGDLENILGYVDQLNEIPMEEERHSAAASDVNNILREDEPDVINGEYTEALLQNAPKRNGNSIEVKKIIGGSQ